MYQKIVEYHKKLAAKICVPVNFSATLPAIAKKFRMFERDVMNEITETNHIDSDWDSIYIYWGDSNSDKPMGKVTIINSTTIELIRYSKLPIENEFYTFAQFKQLIKAGTILSKQGYINKYVCATCGDFFENEKELYRVKSKYTNDTVGVCKDCYKERQYNEVFAPMLA